MIYYYDIHIHSVLSPCADVLMTPNNIFNMAMLKQLDFIAVTDHNCTKQLPVLHELSKSYDLLFIPGIEITVKENIDLLIYFKTLKDAMQFQIQFEPYLHKKPITNAHFHEQQIMDIYDQVIACYPDVLVQATSLSILDLHHIIDQTRTLTIIAHWERQKDRVLPYIHQFHFDAIETTNETLVYDSIYVYNSDAHQITDILERTKKNAISLSSHSIDAFFDYFKHD